MQPLRHPDEQRERREDDNEHKGRGENIDCPFHKTINRILERFFPQRDEAKSAVFEVDDRVPQRFLQIAQDNEAEAEAIAGVDDGATGIAVRKLQ